MRAGELATALGKGLGAGLIGTAIMTVSSTIEMKVRGRPASSVPAEAVSKLLGLEFKDEEAKKRFSNLVHWSYGSSWGVTRALIELAGLHGIGGTLAHFLAVWGTGLLMLPGIGVAPPVNQWGGKEIAIDAFHHMVYALATGVAYERLDRQELQVRREELIRAVQAA